MLSIIISSYQQTYYDQLIRNISETIGNNFLYEIIQMWNPNLMGITEAYNLGAEKSIYENLLFIHEDVIFHTNDWGRKLIAHLNKPNIGIIGLAGASYVPVAPSSWTVSEKYNFINILQGEKEKSEAIHIHTTKEHITKVYVVDGVFMSVKKEIYTQFKFNEELLKCFHGYDLDFSLRVAEKFQNFVIDDILIQHFSMGNQDKIWLDANIKIKKKLNINFHQAVDSETEKNVFNSFLYLYFKFYPINIKNILLTLKFYPLKHIKFAHHLFLAKKYYHLIRYYRDINKKHR